MRPSPEQLMRRAGRASFVTALTLIALKAYAAFHTGSLALAGTLMDSGLDLLVSLMSVIAIETAIQPADLEHRFGHGKAEGVAGLLQAIVVSLSAVALAGVSIYHLAEPTPVESGGIAVGVLLVSMAMTWILLRYQRYVFRETGSLAVKSDSMHYKSDFAMNGGVLLSIGLSVWGGFSWADPMCGLAVAAWVMKSAVDIGKGALDMLLDSELPDEERDRVLAIIGSHKEVRGVHDLRTRQSGRSPMFQFHLELDAEMTLARAHVISDEVEQLIHDQIGNAEVLVHLDPDDLPPDEPDLK